MRCLIDTCILVFFTQDVLDAGTTDILSDYSNTIYVSSVSVMEFAHLIQSGRLRCKRPIKVTSVIQTIEEELGFHVDYVSKEHFKTFFQLPFFDNHTDPNDRLIISQAITEKITLISTDTKFSQYKPFGLDFIKASHH